MANRRVLVKRRQAVRNIHKITRTMQMIANARFQAAYKRSVASKPYIEKLAKLVEDLVRATQELDHPLMREPAEGGACLLLVITSTRGLCGGYNGNVLRTAGEHLRSLEQMGRRVELHMVGRKGVAYLKFAGWKMASEITNIGEAPRFEQIEPLANEMMERFTKGEIRSVDVAYMKFVSTGKQIPVVERLLPLSGLEPQGGVEAAAGEVEVQYEFSPDPTELLNELLPATVRIELFHAFSDAVVSEQVARMVAMTAATDAAEDIIKRLTQQYNRARQTAITMELLDIVGGANALS
jgi:F-type H+-transporting ATPase subunit gamma